MRILEDNSYLEKYNLPKEFPTELLNEEWVDKLHNQTLERLNERGGLGVIEIIANIKQLKFNELDSYDINKAINELKELLNNYNMKEKLNDQAVYKLNVDCGRQGELTGLFIAKKSHVKILLEQKLEVYFGEVLGKHSEIFGSIDPKEIMFVSDNPEVIKVIKDNDLIIGYNPFEFTLFNPENNDFLDLSVYDVCEILLKEQTK